MAVITAKLLITIAMLLIIVQDFKYRAIHWSLFPALFALFFFLVNMETDWFQWVENLTINISFILLHIALLTGYFSMRNGRWSYIFDRQIGWGDILMLIVFAAAFSPLSFVFFLVSGLMLTLVVYGLRYVVLRKPAGLIPLAGCLGIFYLLCAGITMAFPDVGNFFTDEQQLLGLIDQLNWYGKS